MNVGFELAFNFHLCAAQPPRQALKKRVVVTRILTKTAKFYRKVKDIGKLDINTRDRIGKVLLRYSEEPLRFAEKLSDPSLGEYRFRIGDYRVVAPPNSLNSLNLLNNLTNLAHSTHLTYSVT